MKKSILSLLLLPLFLGACTLVENPQTPKDDDDDHTTVIVDGDDETGENEDEEDDDLNEENEENHQENTGISLDEWKNYEFHNGRKPAYNSDWLFYFGDSFQPKGSLWENPNEAVDYSGIEFQDKKQYLVSPNFNSYPKVEVRFEFWFSSHQSDKYKAANNEPQFKVEEYDASNKLINVDTIEIGRSDVPKNNTPYKKTLYITQSSMTSFNFRFNNFIPNGDSGYTAVLCKISLKGWPRV